MQGLKCPKCESEEPPENRFCGECGARLPKICPECGYDNAVDAEECAQCKEPLEA